MGCIIFALHGKASKQEQHLALEVEISFKAP